MPATEAAFRPLMQSSSRLYMHFANEVLASFGRAGEPIVREHLRALGRWRGGEMRAAHQALGEPVDMQTLLRRWDNASTYIVKDELESEGHYSPTDVSFDVRHCPAAEAWKADGFHRWGHVYCDEFHQAAATAYHPDGTVVIPINMMKGDDRCAFRWILPANAKEVPEEPPSAFAARLAGLYRERSPEHGAQLALVRCGRLLAARHITFSRAIREARGDEEAEASIRAALRSWSAQRGKLLRERHEQEGVATNAVSLLLEQDLAPQLTWELTEVEATPSRCEIVVDATPMDDAFADYDAGWEATLFWEELLPELAAAYNPSLRARCVELTWRGDPRTTLLVEKVAH